MKLVDVVRAVVVVGAGLCVGSEARAFSCPADAFLAGPLGTLAVGNTCGFGNLYGGATCGAGQNSDDNAFAWVAPFDGTFTFDTFGSTYDTAITVRDGNACTELGCNDDAGGTLQSSVTVTLFEGQELILVVDGWSNASCGDYVLFATGTPSEPVCGFDVGIQGLVGPSVITGNTCGFGNFVGGSCAAGAASDDLVLRWQAPSTGQWAFDTVGSAYDTALLLQRGTDCTELACDDDSGGGGTSLVSRWLTAGESVNVVVDGFSTGSCGDFVLSIQSVPCPDGDGDGTCDAVDGCPTDPAKVSPGACGCGASDTDTDSDGVPQCLDLCLGSDASGDADADGLCNDRDVLLSAGPAVLGATLTVSASGARPGSLVYLLVGTTGTGPGPCDPVSGLCSDVLTPSLIRRLTATGGGTASFVLPTGKLPPGATLYLQVAWYDPGTGDGETSNVVVRTW